MTKRCGPGVTTPAGHAVRKIRDALAQRNHAAIYIRPHLTIPQAESLLGWIEKQPTRGDNT